MPPQPSLEDKCQKAVDEIMEGECIDSPMHDRELLSLAYLRGRADLLAELKEEIEAMLVSPRPIETDMTGAPFFEPPERIQPADWHDAIGVSPSKLGDISSEQAIRNIR